MKTLTLPQQNLSAHFKRNTNHSAASQNTVSASTLGSKKDMSASEYIISALGEGFKQNFLGADINMEFLTLTVRNYATSTVKALRKIVDKPAKQQNINQTVIHI
ncbi:hypothetical protein NAF17_07905 [Mucilaginibacter sp. RB4R14]|uniref:hypothetical protein n=1 Tax=Mucilaginibacter aurantiaciroseus TaxID=2949308 RepID=UPI002091D4BC|nr:hypothetical protein [Mucilaginibacter aurantiaciroseus]MCO5935462.1 hypothetical protein [Mucilaginibacter aurantiaciroseus]